MTHSPSVLRSALSLFGVRLVFEQIGLALLVFLLSVLWLRMPDAGVLDVVGSVLLALIILAVTGAGESVFMLRVAGPARTPARLLRGTLLLLAGVALWLAWNALVEHLHGNDYLRAGYWNSRFPYQLRNFFSFAHILLWLGWFWTTLTWIGAGFIALFVFAGTASARPRGAILRALRCLTYWIAVILGTIVATVLAGSLLRWTPGHGLRVELISLLLRLSVAAIADAIVVCFLMAILATCIRESDALYAKPAGRPDDSQPRTADNP